MIVPICCRYVKGVRGTTVVAYMRSLEIQPVRASHQPCRSENIYEARSSGSVELIKAVVVFRAVRCYFQEFRRGAVLAGFGEFRPGLIDQQRSRDHAVEFILRLSCR